MPVLIDLCLKDSWRLRRPIYQPWRCPRSYLWVLIISSGVHRLLFCFTSLSPIAPHWTYFTCKEKHSTKIEFWFFLSCPRYEELPFLHMRLGCIQFLAKLSSMLSMLSMLIFIEKSDPSQMSHAIERFFFFFDVGLSNEKKIDWLS